MPLMGPRHHGLIRAEAGLLTPIQVGFASNATGNPTPAAHQAGDTLVSIGASGDAHAGVAPSITTAGWTLWDSVVGGTNRSIAVYHITAAGAGTLCEWTGATSARTVWVFRDAAIDTVEVTEAASSTTLDWAALAAMAADCLVGAYVLSRNAQTNVDAVALAGFNIRVSREAAHACWAGDSDPTLLDAFDPANGTFDTISSGHVTAAFSMKGAPA